jgi:proline dehydrogenase
MERICSEAKALNNFVRIDMEDSSVTQSTVDIFRKLLAAYGRETVGLVIQSYLYRSLSDVSELGDLGANLRIVKGAYKESGKVAYLRKADVNQNYVKLVKMHLGKGCYTAVATHDSKIINEVKHYINVINISKNWFEFQMLYGIATNLQLQLAGEGYRVRVYTPFGKHWYPYFTRRISERPANLFFVLKHLFRKR